MATSARPSSEKSTTVRSAGLARRVFSTLGAIAPGLAAALAERLLFTSWNRRRSRGDALLATAERLRVTGAGAPLAAWRFGAGPAVLLAHGWDGKAGQLTSFVAPLVERGFSVVAFDAPGHGRSGGGMSSLPQFARAITAVAGAVKEPLVAVVAHSMGAAATALAIRQGLEVERVVFLAPTIDPPGFIRRLAPSLGISPRVLGRLQARSERRIGMPWDDLGLVRSARGYRQPLLVIHDVDDREVPFGEGAEIAGAWPGARLVSTVGLGHNGLLRDRGAVADVVDFLGPAEPLPPQGFEAYRLDRELFEPARRWRVSAPAC